MEAVALFSGAWLGGRIGAFLVPIAILGITDWVLGWHGLWPFTWGATLIGVVLGRYLLSKRRLLSVLGVSLLQACIFFGVTNFGVWLQGYYGYTWTGLWACYTAAIPFFHYQVFGAWTYGLVLWGIEWAVRRRVQAAVVPSSPHA
jgi:hypothetical protein